MDAADKRMLDREALRNMIQQWNANRLDLFELSEPNENLEFHGVMRFYFQDSGQKIATKCIRVASDATVSDVIETLIEKFRPDMRMLSLGSYSLWETHGPDDERKLEPHEKPLLVQLNWHADDREGRFLLKCLTNNELPLSTVNEKADQNFKRKLSKREKKELKKKEKLSRLKSDTNDENRPVAEKLYTELPETSFTRSISNPEAVMRRRRQQKLERKLQQFRSKDGGPDTGGTLKIYGSSLCADVPYKTLLLSVGDTAAGVLREMLDKYGLARHEPQHYCIVQVDTADNSEYILEDDECPLAIVMTHPHRSSIMFHVRRRPSDAQPRRRKKKTGVGTGSARPGSEPMLLEVAPDGSTLENGRRIRVTDVIEVGSGNGTALQLYGPSIQPRHCVVATAEGGGYTVTPLHTDAHVYVNGRRTLHSQRLQHGCLLKFGRVSTFRFVDPAQENIMNRNLSQSQHFGSGSIYDRSPSGENSGAMSPTSLASHQPDGLDSNANVNDADYPRTISPVSHDTYGYNANDTITPYNNNTLKLDNESLMMSQHLSDSKDDYIRDEHSGSVYNEQDQSAPANRVPNSQYKDNYETTFDLEGNVETKSICSAKSGGSGHDNRSAVLGARGQEAILPAVLEFPEAGQAQFLAAVVSRLDPHAPAFKLAPVYTLYLCARYRASTHYRPELTPTERAHKLTAFLHHVATLIHATVQERCTDSAAQAFWMANASELLHFLKCDRHISSFSTQAQDLLPTTVQNAFSNLVSCFQEELSRALAELTEAGAADATEATAPTLQALAAAMVLLRRCRVNAALTIQLFSHLFHYINAVCFNKLVTEAGSVSARWGAALSARLALVAAWAERQGLELAADCHLARTHQAARLIAGSYRSAEEVCGALGACFKLNSVQVRALLAPLLPPDLVDAAAAHARARADELYRADGREIALEESVWLGAALLIPGDGFSAEVVRGVPPGLAEFVAPLQRGGLCRLAHQPHALGLWTVYMHGYGAPPAHQPPDGHPRVHIVQLHKNTNGMGLSIVAAKGAGQSKLGIYIKSVVPGGAAAADGRLAAGDQLLSVDGHSLVGITQEKAAEYLMRTGPTVTLEVAKQGAVLHGLATLLHQPTYNQRQGRGRHSYRNRYNVSQDESSESSTDDIPECRPHYHGSIPRLIITLDRENNQLQEDLSPETPGCPQELRSRPVTSHPIPIFTFTCEDMDEQQASDNLSQDTHVPQLPPPVPEAPANYDLSSESGEAICLPPEMKPIDTKLTLDLFNSRAKDDEYRRRCTGIDECVSACECCRTPQPETQQIPFIDEPNSEPVIFENDCVHNKVATPKIRRILPSLSLDLADDRKLNTSDAVCQTQNSPTEPEVKPRSEHVFKKIEMRPCFNLETKNIQNIHCRLRKTLFSMTKSLSSKSDDTEVPSLSTSDSYDDESKDLSLYKKFPPKETETRQMLDPIDRKSWKSPDEYRPAFGKVKELTKHFNQINLKYCVKNYKRNCQSSPNLSTGGLQKKSFKIKENLPVSTSLADIQYECDKTDADEGKTDKMSEDEVKSILIQLEDWSKFGSRGSEDTLAQGNEFELPNLPSEDHTETNASTTGSFVFNEIVDRKPKKITLENIKLKTNLSGLDSEPSQRSNLLKSESLDKLDDCLATERGKGPRELGGAGGAGGWARLASAHSCPDVAARAPPAHQSPSCKPTHTPSMK
ncbi:afadin isoform X2 [Nymphalis io]|uniref:afadin isoform X2 n=1 Tax=Inachis io TaxID=171585 RepID=UPI00216975F1|nr:afadin isoform X2 [Nymphalis io]